MSVSSFTRPTLHRVCRSCRQRLFSQPQSTCLVPSAQLSTTPAPPPETLTGSPANRKTWARQPIGLAIQDGRNPDRPEEQLPRWQRTPQAMKAPIRINPRNRNMDFAVNEDPKKLDEVLARLLGQGTEDWLPQEVKFLAVTHKSFDYGRRGFNDRLAFLGRRIVELQTSLALLDAPQAAADSSPGADSFGRTPFQHPSLNNIETITKFKKSEILTKERLSELAIRYGLDTVTRWKPKQVGRLKASGIELVLNQTLYAIVGGVATQKGGEAAAKLVRERILQPLGLQ